MTDRSGETLEVQTVSKKHKFNIATEYNIHFNKSGPSFLEVIGDDDFEDGPIAIRQFNLVHVIDFGWI